MSRLIWVVGLTACGGQPTPEAANLPTLAVLPTVTATATAMPTTAVTPSATPTTTDTAAPTATATVSVTPSATITETATGTPTNTPTATDTAAPTSDNEGIVALALTAAFATVIPLPTLLPTVPGVIVPVTTLPAGTMCQYPPPGGFGLVFASDPTLILQIGCPTPLGQPPVTASLSSAAQAFERGLMVWTQPASIYALTANGRFQRYDDTYDANVDPAKGGETPPPGLIEPQRGFGKVWRTFPDVRNGLGWARDNEVGGVSAVQAFERGQMIALPQRGEIVILVYDAGNVNAGTWRAVPGSP